MRQERGLLVGNGNDAGQSWEAGSLKYCGVAARSRSWGTREAERNESRGQKYFDVAKDGGRWNYVTRARLGRSSEVNARPADAPTYPAHAATCIISTMHPASVSRYEANAESAARAKLRGASISERFSHGALFAAFMHPPFTAEIWQDPRDSSLFGGTRTAS